MIRLYVFGSTFFPFVLVEILSLGSRELKCLQARNSLKFKTKFTSLLFLGSGQLVQTADGRLVAVGPGNTLVEVGTFMDPR